MEFIFGFEVKHVGPQAAQRPTPHPSELGHRKTLPPPLLCSARCRGEIGRLRSWSAGQAWKTGNRAFGVRSGQLYFRRWTVELCFRDIKTTLGLDVLRCRTPTMGRKEIVMHAIAFNLIRALMQDIAQSYQLCVQRLSFKGT